MQWCPVFNVIPVILGEENYCSAESSECVSLSTCSKLHICQPAPVNCAFVRTITAVCFEIYVQVFGLKYCHKEKKNSRGCNSQHKT